MADNDATATDVKPVDDMLDLGEAMLGDDAEDTSTEESSTDENNDDSKGDESKGDDDKSTAEESDETDGDDKTDESEEGDETGDETDETDADDKNSKPKDAESRKAQLNNEIRQKVAERNALREEIATLNAEKYRTQTEEELVAGGMDPADAKVEAAEQKQKLQAYNTAVADLNSTLEVETLQVYSDFPVFDKASPQYDAKLEGIAREAYTKAASPQRDAETGLVNKVNVLPYDFYAAFARGFEYGQSKGQVRGQKATEKMLASAEPTGRRAPAKKSDEDADPFMKGFDSVK